MKIILQCTILQIALAVKIATEEARENLLNGVDPILERLEGSYIYEPIEKTYHDADGDSTQVKGYPLRYYVRDLYHPNNPVLN